MDIVYRLQDRGKFLRIEKGFSEERDPDGCDNESIASWETEEIGSSSSLARKARLFSANTQTTQWREVQATVFPQRNGSATVQHLSSHGEGRH